MVHITSLFILDEMVDPGDDLGNITDSWENLSLASKVKSPQSSRKEEYERDEEKFGEVPDDYSAEAVAKCLLKVSQIVNNLTRIK